MFYLTTHSTHFIYGYMASDIWLRTILIVRKETRCCHMGYSYRLTARVRLYAPSHRQDSTYHGLCYTSRGALAGTRNSSMGPPHEGSCVCMCVCVCVCVCARTHIIHGLKNNNWLVVYAFVRQLCKKQQPISVGNHNNIERFSSVL